MCADDEEDWRYASTCVRRNRRRRRRRRRTGAGAQHISSTAQNAHTHIEQNYLSCQTVQEKNACTYVCACVSARARD